MVKVTFTLDEETVRQLEMKAERYCKSKSRLVRDAIQGYQGVPDKLTPRERDRMLKALREFAATPTTRTQKDVEEELAELRAVRRLPGRLHPVD